MKFDVGGFFSDNEHTDSTDEAEVYLVHGKQDSEFFLKKLNLMFVIFKI